MKKNLFMFPCIALLFLTACKPESSSTKAPHSKEAIQLIELLNTTRESKVMFGMEDTLAYGMGWQTTPEKPWNSDVTDQAINSPQYSAGI